MRKSLGLWPTTNFYVLESRVGSFKGLVQRTVEGQEEKCSAEMDKTSAK